MIFNFTSICSLSEYEAYLDWINSRFHLKTQSDSDEGHMVRHALELVKQYEDVHFPVSAAAHN